MRLYASSGGSEAEDDDIVMFEFNLEQDPV
jgi:hypothetical protein